MKNLLERRKHMIEKDNIKHNIKYRKIGDIFYPIFDNAEPALGYYATEKLNYLKEHHPSKYLLFKYNHKYKNELFVLNCFCEQLFQSRTKVLFENNKFISKIEQEKLLSNIKKDILKTYVYQNKEVVFDAKKFKITK